MDLSQFRNQFIRDRIEEGTLDRDFNYLEIVHNRDDDRMFSPILRTFFHDAEESIEKMLGSIYKPVIDNVQVKDAAQHLMGCSSRVGGIRLAHACEELAKACDDNNHTRCTRLFGRLNEEFNTLHNDLCLIAVIDKFIVYDGAYNNNEARRRDDEP